MSRTLDQGMRTDSWCVIKVDRQEIKANIIHVGRGKFRIIGTEENSHVGKFVDASEIILCIDPHFTKVKAVEITKQARAIMERSLSGSIDKSRAKTEINKLIDEIEG